MIGVPVLKLLSGQLAYWLRAYAPSSPLPLSTVIWYW